MDSVHVELPFTSRKRLLATILTATAQYRCDISHTGRYYLMKSGLTNQIARYYHGFNTPIAEILYCLYQIRDLYSV
jgi:hypothetical protein